MNGLVSTRRCEGDNTNSRLIGRRGGGRQSPSSVLIVSAFWSFQALSTVMSVSCGVAPPRPLFMLTNPPNSWFASCSLAAGWATGSSAWRKS